VLRDGAAAQYGSDAIAGVINVILKADAQDGELSHKIGGYGWKDGLTTQTGISKGLTLPGGGAIEFTGEFFTQNHTDRSGLASGPFYYPLPDGSPDPREATTNPDKVVDGLPDTRTINVGYNGNLPLANGMKLYSFSTFTFRHAKGYEYFRYANDGAKDPTYNYDPTTGSYTQIYPDGYEPNEVIDELDFGSTIGVKGNDLFGWAWDLSSTYGKDDASISVVNTMNATLGPDSPHSFYAGSWINTELTNNFDLTRSFQIGLPKPLDIAVGLEHRNNSYALKPGEFGSYGTGPYTSVTGPDPETGQPAADPYQPTPGAQSFPGFNPAIASNDYRDSFAGYLDFETQPLAKWDVGIAGRFEHYDDFGNTVTGKLSTRYQVVKGFAVRGTVSNGFRAPALGQSHYAATTTNFANGEAFQVGTFPVASAEARAFGATALKPEKSTNFSVGFVSTPLKNLDITVDLYRIYVRHRIMETGQIGAAQYPNPDDPTQFQTGDYLTGLLESAGLDPASAAGTSVQYFTNAANTRTQGVDVVTSYKTNFKQYGSVRWSFEANWNQTTITDLTPLPAALQPVQSVYPDLQLADISTQGFLTVGTPRNKLIFGAQYMKGPFRASLHETRYGHVVDTENAIYAGPIETVAPAWITDLDLSYQASNWLTLGLGANNLFNRYPAQTSQDFQSFVGEGFGKYDGLTPYGYFGGFYYGRAVISF
jgi:iron complex outermembrane receptor protein